MILIAISFHGKEGKTGAGDRIPRTFLEPRFPFQSKENALFDTNRALQKGTRSFFC